MPSMYKRTCSCLRAPDAEDEKVRTEIRGWMLKTTGTIPIPAVSDRFRRNSRTSLRKIARTLLRLNPVIRSLLRRR